MKLKKVFLVFLTAVLLLTTMSAVTVSAQDTKFDIKTYVWDTASKANVATDNFESGDLLTVYLSANGLKIGALVLDLEFDANKLDFSESSVSYIGADEQVKISAYEKEKGKLSIIYDTTSKNAQVNGEFITVSFSVLEFVTSSTTDLKLIPKEAWDSTSAHEKIDLVESSVTVTLKNDTVPDEFIALVKKLEKITVNSAQDIALAEEAFANLTSKQRQLFKTLDAYKNEYKIFSTAKSRYYACVSDAEISKLDAAAKDFIAKNPILKKDISKVTLSDEKAINTLVNAYSKLDEKIKKRLSKSVVEKIPLYETAIEALNQVSEFKETYKYLLETNEANLLLDADIVSPLVNEAILIYGTCNSMAQEKLNNEYKYLTKLKEKIDAVLLQNEEQKEIIAEASRYQLAWVKVLTKNINTVTLEDKTAILLAIEDYKKLSSGAQEYSSDKYDNLLKLLSVLENYEEIEETTKEPEKENTTTVITEEKIEYVPGETKTEYLPGETITEYVSGESKTEYVGAKLTTHRKWQLILLLIAFLCAIYSYVQYEVVRSKHSAVTFNKDLEDEE